MPLHDCGENKTRGASGYCRKKCKEPQKWNTSRRKCYTTNAVRKQLYLKRQQTRSVRKPNYTRLLRKDNHGSIRISYADYRTLIRARVILGSLL